MKEGYIKFQANWTRASPWPEAEIQELNIFRQKLYHLKWMGAYPDGTGYGNISSRFKRGSLQFFISGSGTGNKPKLSAEDYSLVMAVDVNNNSLSCQGPVVASSESMSHAVIYESLSWVQAVIHIHNMNMWKRLLHNVPTTDASAAYGTPEMADSIKELIWNSDLPQRRIFVMEGHKEGIFSFGKNLKEAFDVLRM